MTTLWVILAIVFVAIVITAIRGRKRIWCKLILANNDVMLVYKTASDYWFGSSKLIFRHEDGRRIVFPYNGRWILYYEEVPEDMVGIVRQDIANIVKQRAMDEESV